MTFYLAFGATAPLGFALAEAATPVSIKSELQALVQSHGIRVVGFEHVGNAIGMRAGSQINERLRVLLRGFNHVIVNTPAGQVQKVIVLSRKRHTPIDSSITLKTKRKGMRHLVEARLRGPYDQNATYNLLVDTGADTVVLPHSLIPRLGLDKDALTTRTVQTANGKTQALVGRLAALELGQTAVEDVEVAFIEDEKLGPTGLLGMSVLNGYRMTLDDEANLITLEPNL